MTPEQNLFKLWCRLTGNDQSHYGEPEIQAFLARPQVPELSRAPYLTLLTAGIGATRQNSLPLAHWLAATRQETAAAIT